MSYDILRTDEFSKHLKQLSKKYPSLKKDYEGFLSSLQQNPLQGISLGRNCFKVRMKISSKKTGKSVGARVITFVRLQINKITLLDIYDKSEKETISDKELSELIKKAE
jgi:mRNA-degrading endonuclease RelE of RelBE toxin-antitoxin system